MKKNVYYITKCLNCDGKSTFIVREHNVNKDLSDEAIGRIASENLNEIEKNDCEKCKLFTAQIVVAYDL